MASAMAKFYSYTPFALFDGTNAADVVSSFNAATSYNEGCTGSLLSSGAGVCSIRFINVNHGGPSATLDIDMVTGDCIPMNNYPTPVASSILGLYGSILTNGASVVKYGGFGERLIGGLAVGTQNLAVTIEPAQPDLGYVAKAFLDGPALSLGTVTLGTPVKTSGTVVTVPVILGGLLPITLSTSTISVHVTPPQS